MFPTQNFHEYSAFLLICLDQSVAVYDVSTVKLYRLPKVVFSTIQTDLHVSCMSTRFY